MKTISAEAKKRIVEMRKQNATFMAISKETGWSKSTVRRVLTEASMTRTLNCGKVTEELRKRMVSMYKQGCKQIEIANACGVSTTTVSAELKRTGVFVPGDNNRKISKEVIARLEFMGKNGNTVKEIANTLGITEATVKSRLKRAGIDPKIHHDCDKKAPEPEIDPMTIPGMKKYHIVMELSDITGPKFIREMDICATSKRDAIMEAFKRVNVDGYRQHYKTCKSIHQIDANVDPIPAASVAPAPEPVVEKKTAEIPVEKPIEKKVEEKPVQKSHLKIASICKVFEVEGTETNWKYCITLEDYSARLSIKSSTDKPLLAVEFPISKVNGVADEIFEVLDLIASNKSEKGA